MCVSEQTTTIPNVIDLTEFKPGWFGVRTEKGERKGMTMRYSFTVAGGKPVNLDDIANQLRTQIDKLPPDQPQLKSQVLNQQTGVKEVLVVVRGHENPHTHPNSDLVFSVLEGNGHVQLSKGKVRMSAGSTIAIPKGVCHAYHNTSVRDSVLLATFSPLDSTPGDCPQP
jgi:quercetin dioxygenase-like cupin family protein